MRQQYHSRAVGEDIYVWDVHRLVALAEEHPVVLIPLSSLAELDENWWYSDPSNTPTPRSIASHMGLVNETNLDYPIILCAEGRLMDGMHRAVKAILEGEENIKAVRFQETPSPDHINVSLDDLPYDDMENSS